MTDGPIQIDSVKANPYMLVEPDELGVLGSTRWVVEQAKHVQINRDYVRDACAAFLKRYSPATEATWYERFHFYDGTERTVNWLLVLDALNFCFWAEKGQPRWRITHPGSLHGSQCASAADLFPPRSRNSMHPLPAASFRYARSHHKNESVHTMWLLLQGCISSGMQRTHPSHGLC